MICPEVARRQRQVWTSPEKEIRAAAKEAHRQELAEEKATAPLCFVCCGTVDRTVGKNGQPRTWYRVCSECKAKGYVGSPCKGCGGALKRVDQHGPKSRWRSYCGICRIDVLDIDAIRHGGRRGSLIRWGKAKSGRKGDTP